MDLASWPNKGAYQVLSASPTGFRLWCSRVEVGGVLLADAEHLCDHASEHLASIYATKSSTWVSSAWTAVTAYYWAFFAAMALGRLLGRTVWFLDKEVAQAFLSLSAAQSGGTPGAGTYELTLHEDPTNDGVQVHLDRKKGRLHDVVWKQFFRTLEDSAGAVPAPARSYEEHVLYDAVLLSARRLGPRWPSDLRNAINYRPGFAYRTVRALPGLELERFLRGWNGTTLPEAVDLLRQTVAGLASTRADASPKEGAKILLLLAFVVNAMTWQLHHDAVERNSLDSRWRQKRVGFLKLRGLLRHGAPQWPLGG